MREKLQLNVSIALLEDSFKSKRVFVSHLMTGTNKNIIMCSLKSKLTNKIATFCEKN